MVKMNYLYSILNHLLMQGGTRCIEYHSYHELLYHNFEN